MASYAHAEARREIREGGFDLRIWFANAEHGCWEAGGLLRLDNACMQLILEGDCNSFCNGCSGKMVELGCSLVTCVPHTADQ